MSTHTKIRASKSSTLPPSDGGKVCAWIERFLVHSEGDWHGQPFKLTPEQRRFVWRVYERAANGRRRYRRVVLGRPKGYGKTELAAALALAELAGPVAPVSPDIPVAASSFDQADLLFGAARSMIQEGSLAQLMECYDTEILRKDGPGRLYRVAAAAGTNDGGRHSFRIADEVHEWTGSKERVHIVLTNGLLKRADSWGLDISTAGDDLESLIGQLYRKGRALEAGELRDDSFLFDWIEHPDPECELDSEAAVREAVELAYVGAGEHVDLEQIAARYYEIPEYEWRRYYLNQFTATARAWLPAGAWRACQREAGRRTDPPPDNTRIVLGFDGSYNRDATGLIGCTVEDKPYLFVVGLWERPTRAPRDWVVPRGEVEATIERAMNRWAVDELACDPPGWHQEIQQWGERWWNLLAFETNKPSQMAPACSELYSAIVAGDVEHDGNPDLARHLANAVTKETADGAYLTKDGRDSPRKIDLAVAAVIAHSRALAARATTGGIIY